MNVTNDRIVLVSLALIAFTALTGMEALAAYGKPEPQSLSNIASGCIGALVAWLGASRQPQQPAPEPAKV